MVLHISYRLIPRITLPGRYYYYPIFTNKVSEVSKQVSNFPKNTWKGQNQDLNQDLSDLEAQALKHLANLLLLVFTKPSVLFYTK